MTTQNKDLTTGNITARLWAFALPFMLGNIFQQFYNFADTWVVGRYIGDNALAAVGSSYTLMTFFSSVIIGLSLGAGSFISMAFGEKQNDKIKNGIFISGTFIGILTLLITVVFYIFIDDIIVLISVPAAVSGDMKTYLLYIFIGFFASFLYNYVSCIMRGMGNSAVPLIFLAISVILNVVLDLYFVISLGMGVAGAAIATVISQYLSGIGILIYFRAAFTKCIPRKKDITWNKSNFKSILSLSGFTCLQQSAMNFGILMVQGLVNSFGATVMAAFTVAVKIDTIAYMPAQDFGNAFSVFVAQNYGAGKYERIKAGIKQAAFSIVIFCGVVSAAVFAFAKPFMELFVDEASAETVNIGVQYLRIEGAFYIGIGILFMLYGYYRAINRPFISVVLTVISLGTRVALAYWLSGIEAFGVAGIWAAVPIGWAAADIYGIWYGCNLRFNQKNQNIKKINNEN